MVVVEDLTASQKDKNRTREDSYSFRHSINSKQAQGASTMKNEKTFPCIPIKTLKVFPDQHKLRWKYQVSDQFCHKTNLPWYTVANQPKRTTAREKIFVVGMVTRLDCYEKPWILGAEVEDLGETLKLKSNPR